MQSANSPYFKGLSCRAALPQVGGDDNKVTDSLFGNAFQTMTEALFDYQLRKSARARRVRLRVSMQHGLEVVVPARFNPARVPALLHEKREWIRAALERAATNRMLSGYDATWRLPDVIHAKAIDSTWQVLANASKMRGVKVREHESGTLVVTGNIDDAERCRTALARWLVCQAHEHLLPRLAMLSARIGVRYRRASIKRQRTRWGSCSANGAINLNAKLMFQPPDVVDYVMIHELCHLREMNHSKRFWSLVAGFDSDYRAHDRALRDGWTHVPHWAS
jgi:predicted metal-dependent hydrolase